MKYLRVEDMSRTSATHQLVYKPHTHVLDSTTPSTLIMPSCQPPRLFPAYSRYSHHLQHPDPFFWSNSACVEACIQTVRYTWVSEQRTTLTFQVQYVHKWLLYEQNICRYGFPRLLWSNTKKFKHLGQVPTTNTNPHPLSPASVSTYSRRIPCICICVHVEHRSTRCRCDVHIPASLAYYKKSKEPWSTYCSFWYLNNKALVSKIQTWNLFWRLTLGPVVFYTDHPRWSVRLGRTSPHPWCDQQLLAWSVSRGSERTPL